MILKKTITKKSKISGEGVYADEDIKKGEVVFIWVDGSHFITEQEYDRLQNQNHKSTIELSIRYVSDLFLNFHGVRNNDDYVNHSFNPNLLYHLGILFSKKDISKGDELTVDYRLLLSQKDRFSFTDRETSKEVIGMNPSQALLESTNQLLEIIGQSKKHSRDFK